MATKLVTKQEWIKAIQDSGYVKDGAIRRSDLHKIWKDKKLPWCTFIVENPQLKVGRGVFKIPDISAELSAASAAPAATTETAKTE